MGEEQFFFDYVLHWGNTEHWCRHAEAQHEGTCQYDLRYLKTSFLLHFRFSGRQVGGIGFININLAEGASSWHSTADWASRQATSQYHADVRIKAAKF